ncbi:MAG TPA: DUF488 domain-containing protein [Rhodanobacteraceae bacterium]
MSIAIKRAYEAPTPGDGQRVLVDRLWPRGISKDKAALDEWAREVAPSTELRQWFGHDPAKWKEFQKRFTAELDANEVHWKPLLERARKGHLTLVFSAHDEAHCNAVVLKAYLEKRL